MQKEAMNRRFVQSIVLTSHIETVEGSVCADVLTGIGVGGGMKIDSDIPTFVLWFVWIFPLLWHLTLDLDLECHLDIIDSFSMRGTSWFILCMHETTKYVFWICFLSLVFLYTALFPLQQQQKIRKCCSRSLWSCYVAIAASNSIWTWLLFRNKTIALIWLWCSCNPAQVATLRSTQFCLNCF